MTEKSFIGIQQEPVIYKIGIWLWTSLHINDYCLNTIKWLNDDNKMPYQRGQLHPKWYATTERKYFRNRQLAKQTSSDVSNFWNIWALPDESLAYVFCIKITIFTLFYNLRAFLQNVWCYKFLFTYFNAAHCSRKCIQWGLVSAVLLQLKEYLRGEYF